MELKQLVNEIEKLSLKDKHQLGEELRIMLSKADRETPRVDIVGKIGEDFFDNIFSSTVTAEIKTEDAKWQETGNVYIENLQYSSYTGKMELSGIMTTTSDIWVTVLLKNDKPHCAIINNTNWLKENVRELERFGKEKGRTKGGSATHGFAIPLEVLIGLKEI